LLSPTRIVSPVLPFNSQTALNTEILIGPLALKSIQKSIQYFDLPLVHRDGRHVLPELRFGEHLVEDAMGVFDGF
jgi:hypothetical protein